MAGLKRFQALTTPGAVVAIALALLAVGGANPRSVAARPMVDVKADCRLEAGAAGAEFPGFSLEVSFSDKAMTKMMESKETVMVAGYLSAEPKPGALKKYVDHIGQVDLGECDREVAVGEIAKFGEIRLDPVAMAQAGGEPQLLINVFSGRKSSQFNLLDCGIYEGPLKAVQGKTLPIACKLIGEP